MYGDNEPAPFQEPATSTASDGPVNGTPAPDTPPPAAPRGALENLIRPLAIAGMLTCIVISLSQFLISLDSDWPSTFIAIMTFLVALDSIEAERILAQRNVSDRDQFRFRLVEWIVILLILRFGVYAEYGFDRLRADAASWSSDIATFLDVSFVVNAVLMVAVWLVALNLGKALAELEASPIERMPSVTDPEFYLRNTMPHHGLTDRKGRQNRVVGTFFAGGVILLILAGLSQVDVRDLILLQNSRSSGIILNALVYFLLGLLLISQSEYTALRANWDLQGVPVLGRLGRRWILLVIGLLLLIGLISALLPVDYSLGIIQVASTVVRWIAYVLLQIVFLIIVVVTTVVGFIGKLFAGRDVEVTATPTPQPTIAPPETIVAVDGTPAAWWQVLRSLLFWSILVGVAIYSLVHFIGDRWGLVPHLAPRRLIAWLRNLWQHLRQGAGRAFNRMRTSLAQRLAARPRQHARMRWGYVSLRRMSPRERIRYFYVSTLQRSAREGFGRPPAMTPLEYQEHLAAELPEVAEEVRRLSLAFVEARYTEHALAEDDASVVQRIWQAVKHALTGRKRQRRESQTPPAASGD